MAEVKLDKPEAGIQPTDEEASLVGQNGVEKGGGGSLIARSTFVFGENMESRVLKRPAEEQLDRQKAEEEDVKPDDVPGEFPKASPSVLSQRPLVVSARKDTSMDFLADNEDSNSNPFSTVQTKSFIKPSAFPSSRPFSCVIAPNTAATNPFKLKPATLPPPSSQINGQGTKGETIESSHSVTCSLIKEGSLEKVAIETTDPSEKAETSESDATPVKESSTPDPDDKENVETTTAPEAVANVEDTKKNYFIKLSSGSTRDSGFGVFGKFSSSSLRILDQGNQKQTAAENYFLQFAPITSNESMEENTETPKSVSGSGSNFVFGQNLTDRVTSPSKQEGELKSASEYVFGANIDERVKREDSVESVEAKGTTLAESASAYEEARKNQQLKLDEVPKVNGEEDEENVLQAQCKLYLFDSSTQSWLEKGRGLLRLNDKTQMYGSHFHSRLVMRTQGSLRVILNTKVWANMTVDKANPKSIRVTAMDSESKIRVFLIVTEPNHADQIYTAIDYRVQALRYAEIKKKLEQEQETAKNEKQLQEETNEEKGEPEEKPCSDAGNSDEKESRGSDESSPSPPLPAE